MTAAPGTESLGKLFAAANGPVLLLLDEVLNFVNRHRGMAESLYSFVQNLTVAATGTTSVAAVLSLPKSKTETTPFEEEWQTRITKVVKRVAKDLIANDEAEVSEVVRRRLFENIGNERAIKPVAKAYPDWCFERRNQLPPQWTAVDTGVTENKGREVLRQRFEACFPFHPATLSVFQRKWQSLPQYQQTRGTLAMLALWLSRSYLNEHKLARREPVITLGSAPLDDRDFCAVVLGQLGEPRLGSAIETDIAGQIAHTVTLDVDTKGPLRDIYRRVGTAILFESSGGQSDKVAHLPELRFAIGGPEVETTSVDTAATTLEGKSFFIRRAGTDGFRIGPKPKLNKVMADRRASLDDESDVNPAERRLIKEQFERGATLPVVSFPEDGAAIQDTPRLALVIAEPSAEWDGNGALRQKIAEWTTRRGTSPRLYPGALIWCLPKTSRKLFDLVETWIAWRRVQADFQEGLLGDDVEPEDRREVQTEVRDAEEAAKDAVWADYRFIAFADRREPDGLKTIDLGAGHSSSNETLSGRVLTAFKSQGLLNEGISASYIDRNWPKALDASGAWPLSGLRQSFLDGSLTRLLDPDRVLRSKIIEFVEHGDFGLASGARNDGTYDHLWHANFPHILVQSDRQRRQSDHGTQARHPYYRPRHRQRRSRAVGSRHAGLRKFGSMAIAILFVDRSEAERHTLGQIIERYAEEVLGEESEKRGADKERGHLKTVLEDAVCRVRMASLTSADIARFRDRMKLLEYAPATIVRRLNLIQTIIGHARREWDVQMAANPAQMVKRPAGADHKRDRVFAPAPPGKKSSGSMTGSSARSEEERLPAAYDDSSQLLGPVVRFAVLTAMRQGEIVGLRWSDIDLKKRTAVVRGATGTVANSPLSLQ